MLYCNLVVVRSRKERGVAIFAAKDTPHAAQLQGVKIANYSTYYKYSFWHFSHIIYKTELLYIKFETYKQYEKAPTRDLETKNLLKI
jgi:hypothetical protein